MDDIELDLDHRVLTVTLNRPARLNALTPAMLKELGQTWDRAREPDVGAVVITGAGRGFCAGADLREPSSEATYGVGGLRGRYNPAVLALGALSKPVIAAVNGAAAGAGLALACAADLRVVSPAASFVPAFVKIGVVPDSGASFFIVRILGYHKAFDWLTEGRSWSAEEALAHGLATEMVEPDLVLSTAQARARRLAEMPGNAVPLTKILLAQAWGNSLASQLEAENELQAQALADPDSRSARAAIIREISSDGYRNGVN